MVRKKDELKETGKAITKKRYVLSVETASISILSGSLLYRKLTLHCHPKENISQRVVHSTTSNIFHFY